MTLHLVLNTLARFFIVYTFLKSGINNCLQPQPVIGLIASKKWPFPKFIYLATVVLFFAGSLMILTRYYDWLAAAGLIIFTVLSNIFFCNYWTIDKNSRHMTEFLFDANIAIIGGLMLIIAGYF